MNAVVIVLDTLRSDIIGPGRRLSFVDTPWLDKLAADSVVFDRAFGEGQPTLQIRRAFYTGCRSFPFVYNFDRRGHWHHNPGWHKIPPHQDTIAEILSARGWCTGLVADVYHMFKPTMNFWRGFTSYEFIRGQESDNWKSGPIQAVADLLPRYTRNPEDLAGNAVLVQYLMNQRFRNSEEDYQCARVFRTAAEWIEENAANRPFLLWVEAFDPHEPWDPPREYADRYCSDYDGIDFIFPNVGRSPSEAEIERTRALYFGEVTFVDRWVGHLLQTLERLNLFEDTAVVVLSDHGTQVWDHGRFGKGGGNMRAYNTGIVWQMRIPHAKPQHISAFVQSHDVAPTLLDLLGVPYARTDGSSVMPLIRGDVERIRDKVVVGWAAGREGNAGAYASVRTDHWNYVTPVHASDRAPELFDLVNDPGEDQNVIEKHPEVARMLRRDVEAVVGQPLPARLTEVCDPAPPPMSFFLRRRAELSSRL